MMDLQQPRTWTDETIDLALESIARMDARQGATPGFYGKLTAFVNLIKAEAGRRAEIRIERAEFGSFSADWYDSRPLNLLDADTEAGQPEHECGPFPYLYMGCPGCQWREDRA